MIESIAQTGQTMKRLALSLLAVLVAASLGRADSYIVAFHSFEREGKDKEAKDALWALAFRLPNPLCLRYIPYKKATHDEFFRKLREVKKKATKDDVVVVYLGAHGGDAGDAGLEVCSRRRAILSREFFPILESLPCPTLLLIDTCHAGAALQHKWEKTTVVCACRHDETAWTGGMFPALLEALRQHRNWTSGQLAWYIVARTTAFSKDQHPIAFCGSTSNVRITDPAKIGRDIPVPDRR